MGIFKVTLHDEGGQREVKYIGTEACGDDPDRAHSTALIQIQEDTGRRWYVEDVRRVAP